MFKLEFLCFAFLLLAKAIMGVTDEQKQKITSHFLEVGLECIKEHPLTNEDILAFRAKTLPSGDNAGCFAACIFKSIGLMDDDGHFNHAVAQEKAKTIFTDEKDAKNLEEFLSGCVAVNEEKVDDGAKGCDRAKLAFNCLVENSPKFGFNFNF